MPRKQRPIEDAGKNKAGKRAARPAAKAQQPIGPLTAMAADSAPAQRVSAAQTTAQRAIHGPGNAGGAARAATGGLPDGLRQGVERLSGVSMEGVNVHRNSAAPARIGAHAFARGRDIHLAPGQDRHLPHEAWHIAQQAQGRVAPTRTIGGTAINDSPSLEREADVMGARAAQMRPVADAAASRASPARDTAQRAEEGGVAQGVLYFSRNAREPLTPEALAQIKARNENAAINAATIEAHAADGASYYLEASGTPFGRHGFQVQGFHKFIPTPIAPGRGSLKVEVDAASAIGFGFSGRPAWSAEIAAAIMTVPGKENIRHIIPWHMIKARYLEYLNQNMTAAHGLTGVLAAANDLGGKLGVGAVAPASAADDDVKTALYKQSFAILTKLNSAPGNLWAGDAKENQTLNSLRIRVESIYDAIENGQAQGAASGAALAAAAAAMGGAAAAGGGPDSGADAKAFALAKLQQSAEGAGSDTYVGLIEGAIAQIDGLGAAPTKAQVLGALDMIIASSEFDVMPAKQEMDRLDMDKVYANVPGIVSVIHLLASHHFVDAATKLVGLSSPHKSGAAH